MSLFTEDIMVYVENPKKSINKLLELINEFSMVFTYEVNIKNQKYFYMLAEK